MLIGLYKLSISMIPPLFLLHFFADNASKRANSASTVAASARKHSRRVKSSQSSAGVVQQTQPQEDSAEVLPQALVEQIVRLLPLAILLHMVYLFHNEPSKRAQAMHLIN